MEVLWWLAIPIAASAVATFWMSRRGRDASPEQQRQGIDEMTRFREALQRPLPPRHPDR